jgi:hypothetical protein
VPAPAERFREKEQIHCRLARPRYPPGDPGRAKLLVAAQQLAAADVANSEPHS